MIQIRDEGRVRVVTLDRPDALNAFNEALYDATANALMDAADAPDVAVLALTGTGRGFSAGTDVMELATRVTNPDQFEAGAHGFAGLIDQLTDFPKPLLCAVNGLALGVGATLLGFADLVIMSSEARLRCPFTDLAVAPEAASSYLFPLLMGRQQSSWMLLSSEWFSAAQCQEMGLVFQVVGPQELLSTAMEFAHTLASKPIASLIESKHTLVSAQRDLIRAARKREDRAFSRLLGQPANLEAMAALAERRQPDFAKVDAEYPVSFRPPFD